MIDYAQNKEKWAWLPYFRISEFACKESGKCFMDEKFMNRLVDIRLEYNRPMIITSGYRSPEYNARISSTGVDGAHTKGLACDIKVYGKNAHELLQIALNFGFTGVGISQKGAQEGRFIHIDMMPRGDIRPWVWSY